MQAALRVTTRILPGRRIVIADPGLPEEGEVDVIVMLPESQSPSPNGTGQTLGVWDYIQSLPSGPRSAASWEEIERRFQEERDSWDR